MAKVLIGNFKGPKGDKGDTGEGKTGPAGAAGQRGSRWSEGTAITGTSTTATVFSGTGIADALANDMYMNTSTGNVYRCTVGGAAAVAKWVFAGNLKGTKGDKGNTGAKGATGLKALQPNRRWTSTFTTVGATASAPFTDFNRNPVVGDVFMNADGSSNIGQWKVTAISGTTATFQLISYVSAKGAKGDTGASGTADTTFMEASALTKLTSGEAFKTMLGKLAKAVSSVFDKLDKSKVVNNQVTTETGYALDARQANPNIDGTLAKQVADLNGSLNNNRDIIWSSPHTLTPSVINKWVASDNFITLQPGKYILGFKAYAVCNSDVYIDTSIDTKEQSFIFYEKNVNMPVSTITAGETGIVRSVNNVFVATIDAPIELHFLCYTSATITITYETWALKLL